MNVVPPAPHLVIVTLFPGVDALDVTGPAEVFAMANHVIASSRGGYEIRLVGEQRGPVTTFSGIRLYAEETFVEQKRMADTLLVPGQMVMGPDGPAPHVDAGVVAWVRDAGRGARRVVSVCAGTYVTAAAGLLSGHRATTHWTVGDRLAAEYPDIEVEVDPVFVRSGRMWSSAGATASMDLALTLVAEDHGREVALQVARDLVMYQQRLGGQSQLSVPLAQRPGDRVDMRELRVWIGEHLDTDLSVPALAARVSMSERHFSRVFRAETGNTPGAFVESMRLEAARGHLERTDRLLGEVADCCGFGSVESLHRVFRDRLEVTPSEYRRRFRLPATV
jgi:transcriptional regulator GlxA family with amidase domain